MIANPTAFGTENQPNLGLNAEYLVPMTKLTTKQILWNNVQALMQERYGGENLTRLARDTKIGPGTTTRIKMHQTSVGVDVLEKIAITFQLEPWQLLAPEMGAHLFSLNGRTIVPVRIIPLP